MCEYPVRNKKNAYIYGMCHRYAQNQSVTLCLRQQKSEHLCLFRLKEKERENAKANQHWFRFEYSSGDAHSRDWQESIDFKFTIYANLFDTSEKSTIINRAARVKNRIVYDLVKILTPVDFGCHWNQHAPI